MNHQPYLTGKLFWICCKASATSSLIFAITIIASIFLPAQIEGGNHVRDGAIMLGIIPALLIIMLIYFIALSAKRERQLKFALAVQSIFITPISGLVLYLAYLDGGIWIGLINFIYTFCYLSLMIGSGAWVWSRPKGA